jgi:hypothetical protein
MQMTFVVALSQHAGSHQKLNLLECVPSVSANGAIIFWVPKDGSWRR